MGRPSPSPSESVVPQVADENSGKGWEASCDKRRDEIKSFCSPGSYMSMNIVYILYIFECFLKKIIPCRQNTWLTAQKRLVNGPYKPTHWDCAMYFSIEYNYIYIYRYILVFPLRIWSQEGLAGIADFVLIQWFQNEERYGSQHRNLDPHTFLQSHISSLKVVRKMILKSPFQSKVRYVLSLVVNVIFEIYIYIQIYIYICIYIHNFPSKGSSVFHVAGWVLRVSGWTYGRNHLFISGLLLRNMP